MTEANFSTSESLEASLNPSDVSSNSSKFEYNNSIDNSFTATIQIIYDVLLFDRSHNNDEIFKVYITFKKNEKN